MRRSIGASITNGAVSASQRRPAMKVWVFQCPNGALARSLRPLGQRPRKRVILVVAPVSSRTMSRCGSSRIRGWRTSVHSSRACLMSVRSCSLARRVFFEPIAGANEPTRQRSRVSLLAVRRGERARQFRHGDIGLLGHLRQKKGPMRLKLGVASPAARLGAKLPRVRTAFIRFTTKDTDTRKRAAAARRDWPSSTKPTTRSRRSSE